MEQRQLSRQLEAPEPVSKLPEHKSLAMTPRDKTQDKTPEAKAQPLLVKLELEQKECKSAQGQGPYGYAWGLILGIWVVRFTPWFLYAEPWIQWSGSWTRKIWEPVQSSNKDGSEFKG